MKLQHKGETIQKSLKIHNRKREIGMVSKKFAALLRKGKMNAAINLLSENRNRILPLNKETIKKLKLKYPQLKKTDKCTLLSDITEVVM